MTQGPAVLILAFNRPKLLRTTIEAVLAGNPTRIYINVDGPRPTVEADKRLVAEVLELVGNIAWPCPVEIRSHVTNRGLGEGAIEAISWFFSEEASGIILEDDVCISPSSLPLAKELLDMFEGDTSVGSVTLFNPVPGRKLAEPADTVRLSRVPSSQYWGTWSDRWESLVPNITRWDERLSSADLERIGGSRFSRFLSEAWGREIQAGTTNWEGRWMATHWFNRWSIVTTNRNFCVHTGFSADATNSTEQPSWYPTKLDVWCGELRLSASMQVDRSADLWRLNQRYGLGRFKVFKRYIGQRLPWIRGGWRRLTIDRNFEPLS